MLRKCSTRLFPAKKVFDGTVENIPKWQTFTPPREPEDQQPLPWVPDDSDRDPNVKYTAAEMQHRYSMAPHPLLDHQNEVPRLPVDNVPEDMYTYGQEGQTVKCNIFLGQNEPVIRDIDSYPYIWKFLEGCTWSRTKVEYALLEERNLVTPDIRAMNWLHFIRHRRGMLRHLAITPLPPKAAKSSRGGKGKK
eukprot:TRINITY_DN20586_c0_g1_i1.p1 TRINITY_DN20586_c0_g1~~TRINITY_DN20586_c0_g1_i1.p1  ORF type:complete len:204 (+),score=35.00 TRINITY_DN20586_c0_g1_i1:39-614(+)